MYKLLLTWRYLRTRYLAMASIVSVMLGVATLVVVNSVMGGFATKLRDRLRGLQADLIVEYRSSDGFPGLERRIEFLEQTFGDKLEAVTPVIDGFAMLQFRLPQNGELYTRPVRLIGVDPDGRTKTCDFVQHLQSSLNRDDPTNVFDVRGPVAEHYDKHYVQPFKWMGKPPPHSTPGEATKPPLDGPPDDPAPGVDARTPSPSPSPNPSTEVPLPIAPSTPLEELKPFGAVIGYGIATYRKPNAKADDPEKDRYILRPGDRVNLVTATASTLRGYNNVEGFARPVEAPFVITDLFKCEMSEYDANIVFVHIKDMQRLRVMEGRATSLQLRLKNYERDKNEIRDAIAASDLFPGYAFVVSTWEEKQGPLLAAIDIERGLLNVLLFLIIAVAGFGILAIFFMIVVEKTRDIGIMKSLGASNSGVMSLFLSYGLALGLVGAVLGTTLGVAITLHINEIESLLSHLTGRDVFNRSIYYFDKIPTDLQPMTIFLVNFGSVLIALAASVLPALRAAWIHPVRALRYE
jgi:lipoprotein-releasing system permease protein